MQFFGDKRQVLNRIYQLLKCAFSYLQGENLFFRDRKLNVGPAIRKQV